MDIRPIRNDEDLKSALERLHVIFHAKQGTPEYDEMEVLSILIEHYEDENYNIPKVSPHEILRYLMESNGMNQKDLIPFVGSKTGVSEILNGKRPISLQVAAKLAKRFNLSIDTFIDEKQLA